MFHTTRDIDSSVYSEFYLSMLKHECWQRMYSSQSLQHGFGRGLLPTGDSSTDGL